LRAAGARVERVAGNAEHCDLNAVLEHLAALEINDVWVEAGAGLNGALLHAGLIDELIVYVAPRLLGDGARGMFAVPALHALSNDYRVAFDSIRHVGADLRITARVSRVASA
jgi:diaminohydroxyphosphoribosylaminopyrimidine deaminase/5-amino-6-(5-phosphoribosylamino)uracil reductase